MFSKSYKDKNTDNDKQYANNRYRFLNNLDQHTRVMLVEKETSKTKYVLKAPEKSVRIPCLSFYHLDALRSIAINTGFITNNIVAFKKKASDSKITNLSSEDERFNLFDRFVEDHMDDLLAPYSDQEEEFRAALEVFVGEFIRMVREKCSPKYRIFRGVPEENKQEELDEGEEASKENVYVGAKYKEDFREAVEVFKYSEEDQVHSIDGHPIIDDFCIAIQTENGVVVKEINDLGTDAILRYLLGKRDCHTSNWGVCNDYQVMLLDFGGCLFLLDFLDKSEDKEREKELLMENINNIIKIVFVGLDNPSDSNQDNTSKFSFPEQIYQSQRIKNEIYSVISDLKNLKKEQIVNLAKIHLHKFPHHINAIVNEITAGIEFLDACMSHSLKQESKVIKNDGDPLENSEAKRRRFA